ncbi:MAG: glycine--tRNA ligase subunit beta [Desulfosudaceae bacterium]
MKKDTLLIEIGTEELPAGYIEPAVAALEKALREQLQAARIDHDGSRKMSTPRRLAVIIAEVAEKQKPVKTTLTGPPVAVGRDEAGNYTMAAEKFAEKAGVPVSALTVQKTDKGEYLAAVKTDRGQKTRTVLKTILPDLIAGLPFPKSMKWGRITSHFARPVHTLLALYGPHVIGFSWAGINSGRYCWGHPFMTEGRIKIAHPDEYAGALRSAWVIPDRAERRRLVEEEISRAAADLGGRVLPDEELVDIVTNMVEYPLAVSGRLDEKFLELPREVLIMSMRSHQRYFAVTGETGRLLPGFVAVNNTPASDMRRVARGHERVLRARLEDAMFFYQNDLKTPPARRVDSLKRVLFQARLGSMYDKMCRLKQILSAPVFDAAYAGQPPAVQETVLRAAELCKVDLVTSLVVEFPKLQGTMGRIYAAAAGESKEVAQAIEEHYQPVASGGALPASFGGALLAVADKLDTICGCFAAGLTPSGASDPYALRRHGIGIIQILLSRDLVLSLGEMVNTGLGLFTDTVEFDRAAVGDEILRFFTGRMAQQMAEEGLARDVVTAVLNASADRVPDVWRRGRALAAMKSRPDFEPLAVGFKRVANIIKKSAPADTVDVQPERFKKGSENKLYQACQATETAVARRLEEGDYEQALVEMAAMREPVDTFFDDVLVMAEDPGLRNNRLALLEKVAALFAGFADFSAIATEG